MIHASMSPRCGNDRCWQEPLLFHHGSADCEDTLNITFIQHSQSGGPGLIRDYARDRQWNCRRSLFPRDILDNPLENAFDDVVVVLGSPRGVYETEVPWIARERLLMRTLVESEIPVFGV